MTARCHAQLANQKLPWTQEIRPHALVGYGHHKGIPRFKCQACGKVFTSRFGTPLYFLKPTPQRVEMVLWFLAEGVDQESHYR